MANPSVATVVAALVHEGRLTAQEAQVIIAGAASTGLTDLTKTLAHYGIPAHHIQVLLKSTGAS